MYRLIIIIAAIVFFISTVGLGFIAVKNKSEIAVLEKQVEQQQKMIVELGNQEGIAIKIENTFKINNVMGKSTVDAALNNQAEQVASILKNELRK